MEAINSPITAIVLDAASSSPCNPPATCAPAPVLGLRKAFEELRAEIEAIPEADLASMNVDVPAAVEVALAALPRLMAMRARIVDELPRFDIAAFDAIGKRASAASYAHTLWSAASTPSESIPALVDEVVAQRDLLLSDATALARRGLLDAARLATLRSRSGFRNAAYDLLGLVRMMRDHFAGIASKSAISAEELDRSEALGERLLAALIAKDQVAEPTTDAALLRQRAFTLLDRAYDDARRAVDYLRWDEDDVDTFAPSLRTNRGRRRVSTDREREAPQVLAPTPSAPTSPVAAPSVPPSASTAVGMPGSNPFVPS